jgi:hypothetical protein
MSHAQAKPAPLTAEIEAYEKLLPSLMANEGKYAVIFDSALVGVFANYEEGLRAGYEKAKLRPFLVRKISGAEATAYSRDTGGCLTSASA